MFRPFTFKREAQWLLFLALVAPVIAMLLALVVPWLARRLGW
jgi:hypothetical protein